MLMMFKSWFIALFVTRGWIIRRMRPDGEITPIADYSPWRDDAAFRELYERIRPVTLVDVYRLYELWQLVEQTKQLTGSMLEIGTWRGGSAALLATRARQLGMGARLYTCDTFRGVVKAGPEDSMYRGGEHADTSQSRVRALFEDLKLDQIEILDGIFPDETGKAIEDEQFRFCHIDVDTYESAKDVASWIWPRMVRGGVVVYDDYGFTSAQGITKLVNEERGRPDRVVVHNLNGHAVVVKVA